MLHFMHVCFKCEETLTGSKPHMFTPLVKTKAQNLWYGANKPKKHNLQE